MSYNMDISSMLLGDLELFPECVLPVALKDEVGDVFSHQPHPQCRGSQSGSTPSIHDDPFPDWLDLKMDLSFLEDLETTDDVLDDLLQSETDVGQSLDILPALQMKDMSFSPLDLKHIPPEQISGNVDSSQVTVPLYSEAGCLSKSPPPSSPECLVPEMITPDSPVYLGSLVPEIITPDSPVYLGSLVSSPNSPDCTLASGTASPAPVDTTFITFVAPLVQPISMFSPAIEVQGKPLDVVSWSVILGDQTSSVPTEVQADLTLSCIPSLAIAENTAKPKRDCKRKRTGLKKSPGNSKKMKITFDDDSRPSLLIPTSKKDRKRQQNKDAAMRYRLKKKIETDTVSGEGNQLLERNKKLREKAQHLAAELGYLKKLMREMFKAKGLLK